VQNLKSLSLDAQIATATLALLCANTPAKVRAARNKLEQLKDQQRLLRLDGTL